MQNVVLSVHLILALLLIGVVLLQRSEGGGLLGGGGVMSNRGATSALQKVTWLLAVAFLATSITLTILATRFQRCLGPRQHGGRPGRKRRACPADA
ncbi:MAG: preprotein translocase subunit SecG [Defluviimonas denitrificans]